MAVEEAASTDELFRCEKRCYLWKKVIRHTLRKVDVSPGGVSVISISMAT